MNVTIQPDSEAPTDDAARVKPKGNFRWVICGLLFFATALNYMDRQSLGILKPTLVKALHWNEGDYANIVTAFQFTYAFGYLFGGRLMDHFGVKRGLPVAVFLWSIAASVHGFVRTVFGFGCARFGLGLAEGGNFPASIRVVSDWFPVKERAWATGLFNSASNIGAIACPLAVPWLAINWGWPSAFFVIGVLGMLWVLAWACIYDDPDTHPRLSQSERYYIQGGREKMVEEFVPYLTLWRLKASWAYTIACGLTNPVWWFYLFWFPGFIATRYHLTTVRAGFYTSIVYIMATVGSIAGGWFSSMLLNRGWSVNSARKLALLIPALCVLPVFAAASMPNVWGTVLLVGIAGAAHQAWAANLYTFVSDIMPKRAVSSVVGFGGFSGGLLSMAAAQATGLVLTAYHSYVPIFYACSTMYVISFLFIHFMVPVIGTHHGPSSLVAETDAG